MIKKIILGMFLISSLGFAKNTVRDHGIRKKCVVVTKPRHKVKRKVIVITKRPRHRHHSRCFRRKRVF